MMMKALILLGALNLFCFLSSQAQQNFKKEPEKTDCHQLEGKIKDDTNIVELIKSTSFRVQESMKISRYKSPRNLNFFSCDGNLGYLIAQESDTSNVVFHKIPNSSWQNLINSNDPIESYILFKSEFENSIMPD